MAELSSVQWQALLGNRWFAELPETLRADIVRVAQLMRVADRDLLYRKGDTPRGWYGIVEGAIKVSSTSADGREAVLTFLEPGSWFGEISLFDGLPRAHDGRAHGDSVVLVVPPAEFRALLAATPQLYAALMQLQCTRLRLLFAAVEELSVLPLEARLARQLLSLVRSYGKTANRGTAIDLYLPQDELAQLLATSRQRINQVLKSWERDGLLRQRYGEIVVIDPDGLRRIAAPV